ARLLTLDRSSSCLTAAAGSLLYLEGVRLMAALWPSSSPQLPNNYPPASALSAALRIPRAVETDSLSKFWMSVGSSPASATGSLQILHSLVLGLCQFGLYHQSRCITRSASSSVRALAAIPALLRAGMDDPVGAD